MKYFPLLLVLAVGCTTVEIKYPEGGYPYPKRVAPLDLHQYYYPLKDIVSKNDSFGDSYSYLFFEPFNEPNLSIKAQPVETFRFVYSQPMTEDVIITITENVITVKKGRAGKKYQDHDNALLTEIERKHFALLESKFPIDTTGKDSVLKIYFKEELKKYPQLLDPYYYKALFEKSLHSYESEKSKERYSYVESKVYLSKRDYYNWVKELNASGYWSLPYHINGGGDDAMDASGFLLEANTKTKYNSVGQTAYWKDESAFAKACQSLINLAGLGKEIAIAINYLKDEE